MEQRSSFVFYRSFSNAIDTLTDEEEQLKLYKAIVSYALDGTPPELTGVLAGYFELMRPQLDANYKKYLNGCKGKEYGVLGKEYGKQGGRPKKEKTPQKPPKNPPNDNVNDNENVNVNVNVKGGAPRAPYIGGVNAPRHPYGENGNIYLTDGEIENLKREHPNEWKDAVDGLSNYLEATGRRLKGAQYYKSVVGWMESNEEYY